MRPTTIEEVARRLSHIIRGIDARVAREAAEKAKAESEQGSAA
jgi:hypothetical protein